LKIKKIEYFSNVVIQTKSIIVQLDNFIIATMMYNFNIQQKKRGMRQERKKVILEMLVKSELYTSSHFS
jgi:hypothetical protein